MKLVRANPFAIVAGLMLACFATVSLGADQKPWSYAGATGPAKWGTMEKDFSQCKLGENQSPIDIPDSKARKGDLPSLLFAYRPSPLRIIDTGQTIQVNYAPGSVVSVGGKAYELVEFHFHRPSEEKIDGKGHDMVVHLVHKGPDGKPAIVAVLLDTGKENPVVKSLWENLPKEKGKEVVLDNVKINAVQLLPPTKGYYAFSGSQTTPPCTEDVTWFVLKTPTELSADQIARFAKIYPMNARPVQPVNGRDITATP